MSYDGQLSFGLLGDYDAMPELDRVAEDISAAIAELDAAAGIAAAPRRGRARRSAART
jgi:hypothetical protein